MKLRLPTWEKVWRIGRLRLRTEHRSSTDMWGRFGGGWNWKLGFQAGGTTILLNILVFDVFAHWVLRKPCPRCGTDMSEKPTGFWIDSTTNTYRTVCRGCSNPQTERNH